MLILQFSTIIPSRQNSPAVQIAIAVIVAIALIIIIRQLYNSFRARIAEIEKNSPRKKLDVRSFRKVGTRLGFSAQDLSFLEQQCKRFEITYIPLISNTEYCITTVFKRIFEGMCENPENIEEADLESNKLALFMLIYKIELAKRSLSLLTSTSAFTEGLPISYISEDGNHHASRIIENNKSGLFLEVALNSHGLPVQPQPLSKIKLYFELHGGIAYQATTRVMRYQTRNGVEELVLIHSHDVEFFQRRKFRRKDVSLDCTFNAVAITEPRPGNKVFTAQPREYIGKLANISASGCRMTTSIPIKADQYMKISVLLPNGERGTMIGIIVRSRREINRNVCVLNIRFIRMQKKMQNNIFALVYNYENNPPEDSK